MALPRPLLALLIAVALPLSGCGSSGGGGGGGGSGGGTKAFEAKGIDITFDYPEEMKKSDSVDVEQTAGAGAKATAGVGYDNRNAIVVQRFDLNQEVGKGKLKAVKPEVDDLFEQALGQPVDGKATEVGGLPALEYRVDVKDRPGEKSRLLVIFAGKVEYTINCQSNEERRKDLEKACDKALGTVKKS